MTRRTLAARTSAVLVLVMTAHAEVRLRVPAVWLDRYPVVNIAVECVPSEDAPNACSVPSGLSLVEDGVVEGPPLAVRRLSKTLLGSAIVLAVDASGSMRGRPLAAIRNTLAGLTGKARAEDQIAILTFADRVQVAAPFGSNRSTLAAVLGGIKSRGSRTCLYDAVAESIKLLQTSQLPPLRRVIVISDGQDEGSSVSLDAVLQQAKSAQVVLDTIGLSRVNPIWLRSLQQMPSETGGVFRRAKSDVELGALVGLGIDQVHGSTIATFRLSRIAADGTLHSIGVKSGGWLQTRKLQLVKEKAISTVRPAIIGSGLVWALAMLGAVGIVGATWLLRAKKVQHPPEQQASTSTPLPVAEPQMRTEPPRSAPRAALPEKRSPSRAKTSIMHFFAEPTSSQPAAWLLWNDRISRGSLAIDKRRISLGSGESADLRLPKGCGVLASHAYLEYEAGSMYVSSESAEARVLAGKQEFSAARRLLLPGDQFTVGAFTFQLQLDPE